MREQAQERQREETAMAKRHAEIVLQEEKIREAEEMSIRQEARDWNRQQAINPVPNPFLLPREESAWIEENTDQSLVSRETQTETESSVTDTSQDRVPSR